jgi:hypothetical protein
VPILIIGGVLLGAVLGRFLKVWVLMPTFAVTFIAAFASSSFHGQGLMGALFGCAVLLTCLQVGYAAGLFSRAIPGKWKHLGTPRDSSHPPATMAASRPRHFF